MNISKILLVDDDHNIRLIAQIGLEDTPDWSVVTAASGQECIDLATSEKPDLILLDVMMPGMDGKTTFTKLKESNDTADIPVIFMTAKVQAHEMEAYVSMGATGVITKPFDPITLSSDIKRLLGSR
ncbi:MAG TPA: response regulator [Chroococcales cyanobacterium]